MSSVPLDGLSKRLENLIEIPASLRQEYSNLISSFIKNDLCYRLKSMNSTRLPASYPN
jgi:hypothetical protein